MISLIRHTSWHGEQIGEGPPFSIPGCKHALIECVLISKPGWLYLKLLINFWFACCLFETFTSCHHFLGCKLKWDHFLWCPLPTMFVHNTKETISWTYITGHSLIVLHHLLIASVDSEHFANAFGCCVSLITEKKLEEHLKYLNIRVNLSFLQPLQLSIHDPN